MKIMTIARGREAELNLLNDVDRGIAFGIKQHIALELAPIYAALSVAAHGYGREIAVDRYDPHDVWIDAEVSGEARGIYLMAHIEPGGMITIWGGDGYHRAPLHSDVLVAADAQEALDVMSGMWRAK